MRAIQLWIDSVIDKEKQKQCIYDIAFRPDGEQLLVTAGSRVLLYNARNGSLIHALKGHRDIVYCLSYARNGQHFASGGADKIVIIWGNDPPDGQLKFTHTDSVQCIAFSPVAQQLISCTATEIGLWSPEQKAVSKSKIASKACSCCWTNDGQYFAVGHYSGHVTIWTKNGEEKVKIERPGGFPVWSLAWNPSREDQYDILTVCDWGQKLSYYQLNGRQVGRDRSLGFDPTCISYFPSGDFAVISGSNNRACVYSRHGVNLSPIGELNSWVWCCRTRPAQSDYQVAISCQDGTIVLYQLAFNTVHGLYKNRYAYREHLTDVVIQHLITNNKKIISCHDLVKKIAIYKNRLAVQLPEKIVIYEVANDDQNELDYAIKEKINKQFECSLLVVCSNNLVLCHEKKLQCLSFTGEKEREWLLESQIRYIKVIGGPQGREALLVGLRNGQIFKIFVDNPFPMLLLKLQTSVRCLDLSASRAKLAVVDDNSTLLVYNANTKELLFQEPNANSVAWNTQYEDMLCFSGSGMLSIKVGDFPVYQQRHMGFVVGFNGSKIFSLHFFAMSSIDVPQSASMIQYLEKKMFKEAYKIACLGVTEGDWRVLALEALEGMDLDVAKKAFIRVRDLRFLELIHSIEERRKSAIDNNEVFLADIFAYQGKFLEAAELYRKSGQENKAVEMYTDLRQFHLAKEFASTSSQNNVKQLITKQAEWAKTTNDPQAACDMYIAAGEFLKAVEIMGESGWVEKILNFVHELDKTETQVLLQCAYYLKKLNQFGGAAEVYEKMEDIQALVALYVETHQWETAFELVMKHPDCKNAVYMPYAVWLMESDKFDEAQEALTSAGKQNEALSLLEKLARNAIEESRFNDASYYYWMLSKSHLGLANKEHQDLEGSSLLIEKYISQFKHSMNLAEMYYVYHCIHCFVEQPFTSYLPEALHNMARFLIQKTSWDCPYGISKVSTFYTLAKQSKHLGVYKLARIAFDKLQDLRIPSGLQEPIEMGSITIRSKPFEDKEDLMPVCYRCSTTNPLLGNLGNNCVNCKQPFEFSFISFEVLPVFEFFLEEGISDDEAIRLIQKEPQRKIHGHWSEIHQGNTQTLKLEGDDEIEDNSFNMNDNNEFAPVTVGKETLERLHKTQVLIKKWGPPIGNQYYKSIMPEISISICDNCKKMFHADDYELQVLSKGHCPFCRKVTELQ